MATITLSLAGVIDGTQQNISKSATIDDSILPYFFQCYQSRFGVLTNVDAFNDLAMDIANRAASEVKQFAINQALSQIKVPDVVVTPL